MVGLRIASAVDYSNCSRFLGGCQKVPSTALTFPDSSRVIYGKNPLVSVICQLRFAPILKIDASPPAEFQEHIRETFPLLKEKAVETDVPADLPEPLRNLLRDSLQKTNRRAYDFISEDETWTVSLTREFLALSTSQYARWEDFRSKLDQPFAALLAVYRPAFFTRIGLRYQNLIQRSNVDLEGVAWSELLKPQISGILSANNMGGTVAESHAQILIQLADDSGSVRIRHGIGQNSDNETDEECYVIDSDFFTDEKTRTDDAANILDNFNRQSGRLFRWCIEERLHDAMDPSVVETAA